MKKCIITIPKQNKHELLIFAVGDYKNGIQPCLDDLKNIEQVSKLHNVISLTVPIKITRVKIDKLLKGIQYKQHKNFIEIIVNMKNRKKLIFKVVFVVFNEIVMKEFEEMIQKIFLSSYPRIFVPDFIKLYKRGK